MKGKGKIKKLKQQQQQQQQQQQKQLQPKREDEGSTEKFSVTRRKLFDKIMSSSFVIGNTNARSLLTSNEAEKICLKQEQARKKVRLLYLGVGDIRNVLTTLAKFPKDSKAKIEIYINDASSLTLARDILILLLATNKAKKGNFSAAIAIWSDLLLSDATFQSLQEALKKCLNNELPSWLLVNAQTLVAIRKHWGKWLSCGKQFDKGLRLRKKTLGDDGGHGRAGASKTWLETGVSSISKNEAKGFSCQNPTLYDMVHPEVLYVDCQGPGGAFSQLEGLQSGSKEFARAVTDCWTPLLSALQKKISGNPGGFSLNVIGGDCVQLLMNDGFGKEKFSAVDTSNLMDYIGLWNLLLLTEKVIDNHVTSFVFTENILGVADSLENMFKEIIPHNPSITKGFSKLIGLEAKDVPISLKPGTKEKIVFTRWQRHMTTFKDFNAKEREAEEKPRLKQELNALLAPQVYRKVEKKLDALFYQELQQLLTFVEQEKKGDFDLTPAQFEKEVQSFVSDCTINNDSTNNNNHNDNNNNNNNNNNNKKSKKKKQNNNNNNHTKLLDNHHSTTQLTEETETMFQTEFFKILYSMLVPQCMSTEMLADCQKPIDLSYPFPMHTTASLILLLIRLGKSEPGKLLVRGILNKFLNDANLYNFAHVRNRILGIKIQGSIFSNLLFPAFLKDEVENDQSNSNELVKFSRGRFQCVRTLLNCKEDILAPKGGTLEPALAIFLLKDEQVLKQLLKRNEKWECVKKSKEIVNLVYEYVEQTSSNRIQIIDNLQFKPSSDNELKFVLPIDIIRARKFEYLVLVDIQQYKLISEAVPFDKCSFSSINILPSIAGTKNENVNNIDNDDDDDNDVANNHGNNKKRTNLNRSDGNNNNNNSHKRKKNGEGKGFNKKKFKN